MWAASVLVLLAPTTIGATQLDLEQPTTAFSLTTDAGRFRVTLGSMTESIELLSGRRVRLRDNQRVPVRLEGPRVLNCSMSLSAAEGVASRAGAVKLERKATLACPEGAVELDVATELDLLGLGSESPSVRMVSGVVQAARGALGALAGEAVFASARVPLTLSGPRAQLSVHGEHLVIRLPEAFTPDYFMGIDGPILELVEAGKAPVVGPLVAEAGAWTGPHLSVRWREVDGRWQGEIAAPNNVSGRVSVRLGGLDGLTLQAVSTPEAHASLSPGERGTTSS